MSAPDSPRPRIPLTVAELDALLTGDGTALTRNPAAARELVERMRDALRTADRQATELRSHLDRQTAKRQAAGPLQGAFEALAALTPEQRQQVFDASLRGQLSDAVAERERAARARVAALSEAARVRFVISKAVAVPGLPPEAADELRSLLASLPQPSA